MSAATWRSSLAQEDENARSLTGAAFVYRFNGTKWIEEQKLYDPNGEIGDRLGNAVAIEGNLAVVCAEQDDNAKGQDAGSAFVFRYNGASWVLEKQLIASDGKAFDRFGCSVAIDGDRIVVGAREKDGIGTNSGGTYVFRYNGSQWVEEAILQASDMASLDEFGSAVDIDGNTIMVGAQKDPVNIWNSGSVYVYRFNGTSWVETQRFFPQPAVDLAYFGASIALDGDTAVVGRIARRRLRDLQRGRPCVPFQWLQLGGVREALRPRSQARRDVRPIGLPRRRHARCRGAEQRAPPRFGVRVQEDGRPVGADAQGRRRRPRGFRPVRLLRLNQRQPCFRRFVLRQPARSDRRRGLRLRCQRSANDRDPPRGRKALRLPDRRIR